MRNRIVISLSSRLLACLLTAATVSCGPSPWSDGPWGNGRVAAGEPSDYLGGVHHRLLSSDLPAGVVGQARLTGRGPVAGYFQPVAFSGPEGVQFSLPEGGAFASEAADLKAGMLIGAVYRFRITGIPRAPGAELFPTVEVIDRTYPPPGLAQRHPIPINLDQEDLEAALSGQLVTRVITLEDPETALAIARKTTDSTPIDISEYQDALEVADRFGRPVAIVRIGSLNPPTAPQLLPRFYFGYPVWAPFDAPQAVATRLPAAVSGGKSGTVPNAATGEASSGVMINLNQATQPR